jgi:hypothetical protein
VVAEARGLDEKTAQLKIPLKIVVRQPSRLHCWGPHLAGAGGLLLLGFMIYGFVTPSRFTPRVGLMISPEEDTQEGFFHSIRAQRGTRSGFFRDARIYLARDYRFTPRAAGAVARLRADRQQVRLKPMEGNSLWRRTADDGWEPLPPDESFMRLGTLYRDELSTLFFELRNG